MSGLKSVTPGCKFSLKENTTFKIGGDTDYFFSPRDYEELRFVTNYLSETGQKYHIIGKGLLRKIQH